ncbi:N-acetylphosphatidylethanolamine-hydrolyzing phospholipase D Ecym_7074 [Eremothecium cymbalariae DBVPG|uniref:Metallo-beta-lactamase domain-containing protein n=1 Tax=Eremothecium cymbalariae (strain CBS 270.75 / DBVPG 7215 / KCTC 17166 / NRRL Y-17582) TaxID=931890 RepID=G8JVR2_ERECY|nr:hypothetical protein Ecym_7074 [Eremothecium cymbalariae DBVPG\
MHIRKFNKWFLEMHKALGVEWRLTRYGLNRFGYSARNYSKKSVRSSSGVNDDSRNKMSKTWLKALGIVLVPYTCYALYIALQTDMQIRARRRKVEDENSADYNSTLKKYSHLKILGVYENPFNEYRMQTIYEFFFNRVVELFQINRGGIPREEKAMELLMPVHKPTWTDNAAQLVEDQQFTYSLLDPHSVAQKSNCKNTHAVHSTWLGQSCSYVVYRGVKILTDPLVSSYLIHETLGPKRITKVPVPVEDIPTPDVIIVSHNHPDHLDHNSMKYWDDSSPNQPLWVVPKGLGGFLEDNNITRYIELSWWEACKLNFKYESDKNLEIVCTPAMHWSGRGIWDTNRSLWASFLVRDKGMPVIFHAGDTGYVSDLFVRIKQRFGAGVKLALLPCGQYCPEWHQRPRHINPEEALKVMKDLEAQNVLGVHWGTFILSGEYFREPKEKLELLAEVKGIKDRCYCPELGKTVTII